MEKWFGYELSEDEELAVAAFMQKLAIVARPEPRQLPAVDVLWWKAELLRRWEAERRIEAPLDVIEPIQIAAGLAAAAGVVAWALPSLVKALALIHM